MTAPQPAPRLFSTGPTAHVPGTHHHLWYLPDGTGLHAPVGQLIVDADTGRLACHLCGRWYVSLGSHVRVHGHTADTYRTTMGVLRTRPLVAATLSTRIAARQRLVYLGSSDAQAALAHGHELARTGELGRRARLALRELDGRAERARRRDAALRSGRERSADERKQQLAARLAELDFPDLATYLRTAYAAGASVEQLRETLRVGRSRLRRELAGAGVTVRPTGRNSASGKRSRARTADVAAAERLGTDDVVTWLAERRAHGWPITRLAAAVGHSPPWVRARLAVAPDRS